ncbi:MAG: aldehyde dehydrogenase family protein [Acidobacteria bacterium]|nr:aldehyde dehydrogenase family protein [Acidobacteriota bacterium]
MMGINIGIVSNAASPFGGIKMSGLGREGGAEGLLQYMLAKYTLFARPQHSTPDHKFALLGD